MTFHVSIVKTKHVHFPNLFPLSAAMTDHHPQSSQPMTDVFQLQTELAEARREVDRLKSELADLQILYESTIEHGEAVEDQLAESNILLQTTQRRLDEELAEAANYIMGILPPRRTAAPHTEWHFVPSTELGGDSFGYHDIDADHMAFYLLDVCGHGVGAALLSVTVINVLRSAALVNTDFRNPGAVLSALNDTFPMERQSDMYFTLWYGVYRKSTGMLHYSSGGHPPSLLLRTDASGNRQTLELTTPGVAIGVLPEQEYESAAIAVQSGDRLLVLSDGAYEIEKSPGTPLEFSEFVEFVAAPDSDHPVRIFDWIKSYSGPAALPDDFTLLRVIF